ncbi:MAG: cold shock domain-containing protein [Pseudomonadales bacterium]
MPFISASVIGLIGAALGAFLVQAFAGADSFIASFIVIFLISFIGIGINNAIVRSAITGQTSTAQPKPRKKPKKQEPAKRSDSKPAKSAKPTKKPAEKPSAPRPVSGEPLEQGTVKWFNGNKGFGFICRENGEEVFVHFRSIESDDESGSRRHLRDGQAVEYRVVDSDRGPQAENVRAL